MSDLEQPREWQRMIFVVQNNGHRIDEYYVAIKTPKQLSVPDLQQEAEKLPGVGRLGFYKIDLIKLLRSHGAELVRCELYRSHHDWGMIYGAYSIDDDVLVGPSGNY